MPPHVGPGGYSLAWVGYARDNAEKPIQITARAGKHAGDDLWLEVEAAIQKLQLFKRKRLPEISHTICDECLHNLDVNPT